MPEGTKTSQGCTHYGCTLDVYAVCGRTVLRAGYQNLLHSLQSTVDSIIKVRFTERISSDRFIYTSGYL